VTKSQEKATAVSPFQKGCHLFQRNLTGLDTKPSDIMSLGSAVRFGRRGRPLLRDAARPGDRTSVLALLPAPRWRFLVYVGASKRCVNAHAFLRRLHAQLAPFLFDAPGSASMTSFAGGDALGRGARVYSECERSTITIVARELCQAYRAHIAPRSAREYYDPGRARRKSKCREVRRCA
jgi:hypothetical protein